MIKNKKGFMKIVEATVAITIILAVIIIFSSNSVNKSKPEDISNLLPPIMEEISRNETLRFKITQNYDTNQNFNSNPNNQDIITELEDFVRKRLRNKALNSTVRICNLTSVCSLERWYISPKVEEIYSSERVISTAANASSFEPRKLKIFLWRN